MKISFENIEDVKPEENTDEQDAQFMSEVDAVDPQVIEADSDTCYSEVEEMELSHAMEQLQDDDEQEYNDDVRALDTSSALVEVADNLIKNEDSISVESIQLMGKFAVTGTDLNSDAFICLESFKEKNKTVALENIGNKISAVLENVLQGIVKIVASYIPHLRSLFTFFSFQSKQAKQFISQINALESSKKVAISVKGKGYMAYGENQQVVKTGTEYAQKAAEATTIISSTNAAAINFTKSRFLSKVKATLSILTAGIGYEKQFFDMYSHLQNDLLQPLSKIQGLQVFQSEEGYKAYKSDVVLGGWQLEVKIADLVIPQNKNELSSAMKDTIGVLPKNTAALNNVYSSFQNGELVSLEFNKTNLLQIAEQSLQLSIECEKHINFNIKWNLIFSDQLGSIMGKALNAGSVVYAAISQVLSVVRIVRLGAYLTSTVLGSSFKAAKGLISNNFKIIKQALALAKA